VAAARQPLANLGFRELAPREHLQRFEVSAHELRF
jgi:hypothetical protein